MISTPLAALPQLALPAGIPAPVAASAWLIATLAGLGVAMWPRSSVGRPLSWGLVPSGDRRSFAPGERRPSAGSGVEAVAAALDLLALALRGGGGVVEAVEAVAALGTGAVAGHLRTVGAAMRWGMEPDEAWESVPPVWQSAGRAMVMAAHAGIAPAELLTRAADDLRQSEIQRLEEATSRLGVLLVLPLGLAFLPAFVLTTVVPLVLALARQSLGS